MKLAHRLFLAIALVFMLIFAWELFELPGFAQVTNTFYADQFPGTTVGEKVRAAQAACHPDTTLPCRIVLRPILAVYATGVMPATCPQCIIDDQRNSGTGVVTSVAVGNIATFKNALTNAERSAATTQISVAWIGDSYAVGENITTPVRTALQNRYGNAGVGWIDLYYLSSVQPGVTVGAAGTWVTQRQTPASTGLNISDIRTSDIATPARVTVTLSENASTATLYYYVQPGGGSFKWWVDSNTAINVNTAGPAGIGSTTISGLSNSTAHTFQIQITAAGTSGIGICGMDVRSANTGIVVHNLGSAGSDTANWVNVNASLWQAQLTAIKPALVAIMLSPNDQADGISVAQQYTNLQTLVGRIRAAMPGASIALMPPPDNGLSRTPTMQQYNASQSSLAASLGLAYVDVLNTLSLANTSVSFNPLWFNPDLLHPNTVGGQLIANVILQGLNDPLPAGPLNYDAAMDVVLSPPSSFAGDSNAGYGSIRLKSQTATKGAAAVFSDASGAVLPFKIAYNDACASGMEVSPATAAATNSAPPAWGTQNLCFFSGYTKLFQSIRGDSSSTNGGSYGSLTLSPEHNAGGSALVFKETSTSVNNWMLAHNNHVSGGLEFTPSTATGGTTFTTPILSLKTDGVYVPAIKSTTGTRYVCVDTNGKLVSQTTACSGT